MRHATDKRLGGNGFADYLKKSVVGMAIASAVLAVGLQGGIASATGPQDPVEIMGVVEYVAPGAAYLSFTIANGDPNEELGGGGVEQPDEEPGERGPGVAAPESAQVARPNIQAGDDQDKPAEEAAPQPDYSKFTIANGDPNEEQGGVQPPGSSKVQPALEPAPAVRPNIQAGDDQDKPVERPDYSGFTIANGDPNEEGNN